MTVFDLKKYVYHGRRRSRADRERYRTKMHRIGHRMLDLAEALLADREIQSLDTAVRDYACGAVRELVEQACRIGFDGDYITDKLEEDAVWNYRAWAAFSAAAFLDAHGFNLRFLAEDMRKTIGWREEDGWSIWRAPRRIGAFKRRK